MRISDWSSDVCSSDLRLATYTVLLHPALEASDRQRAGRLRQCALVVKNVARRCADLIDADLHRTIDQMTRDAKRLLADLTDRDAISKPPDLRQYDAATRLHRNGKAVRSIGRSEERRERKEGVSTCKSRWEAIP